MSIEAMENTYACLLLHRDAVKWTLPYCPWVFNDMISGGLVQERTISNELEMEMCSPALRHLYAYLHT